MSLYVNIYKYTKSMFNKRFEMNQKLDKNQVIEIYLSTQSTKNIASVFQISATTVNDIKGKRIYKEYFNTIVDDPGRPLDSRKNTMTDEKVKEVYYFSGSPDEIKTRFGCSVRVARNIKFGVTYQHIT